MQRLCSLVLFLLVAAGLAGAQIPTKGNIFFGYSYNRAEIVSNDATNLNGWNGSLEGKFLPWIGLVVDISGTYGSGLSEHNALFGPRVSVEVSNFRPFAQLFIGAAHISGQGNSDTSFGNSVGGGLDYRVVGPLAIRGQLDWIHTRFFSNDQNDIRFSTGLVLHF
jgi:opacity protein-like surface antigen